MPHDIIDNRTDLLSDSIKSILPSCESAKFAVGYFFLSGFTAIADQLDNVKDLRLLIGSVSSAETIEQIAEGARRLQEAEHILEGVKFPKAVVSADRAAQTALAVGETASAMDQSDENAHLILSLARAIEEKRVKVKV